MVVRHNYTFTSDGANLTPEVVARIARSPLDPQTGSALLTVGMSPGAKERVENSRAIVDGLRAVGLDPDTVVHGTTLAPRQPRELADSTSTARWLGRLDEIDMTLQFTKEGLRTRVKLVPRPGAR